MDLEISETSRYERNEMNQSTKQVKRWAACWSTTVSYLLGESEEDDLLKDKQMIQRLNELRGFPNKKQQFFFNIES